MYSLDIFFHLFCRRSFFSRSFMHKSNLKWDGEKRELFCGEEGLPLTSSEFTMCEKGGGLSVLSSTSSIYVATSWWGWIGDKMGTSKEEAWIVLGVWGDTKSFTSYSNYVVKCMPGSEALRKSSRFAWSRLDIRTRIVSRFSESSTLISPLFSIDYCNDEGIHGTWETSVFEWQQIMENRCFAESSFNGKDQLLLPNKRHRREAMIPVTYVNVHWTDKMALQISGLLNESMRLWSRPKRVKDLNLLKTNVSAVESPISGPRSKQQS